MFPTVKAGTQSLRQIESGTVESRTDLLVAMLLDHLSGQELARMPTINSLAASLNMSTSHLRHIVKQKTGVSFSRYVKKLRLCRARRLLQETFWSVKQVMLEVGVSDHSHFAKDYKKEFGESPTQTRLNAMAAGKKIALCEPRNSHFGHKQTLAMHTRNGNLRL